MLPSYQVSGRLAFCFGRVIEWIFKMAVMACWFLIGTILTFLIYKSPLCFLPRFKSTDLSVQEKKRKTDVQDGVHGSQLGLQIEKIFSYFCSTRYSSASYLVLSQLALRFRRRSKLDFQGSSHGSHLGFPIRTSFAIFHLQVAPMLPTKF